MGRRRKKRWTYTFGQIFNNVDVFRLEKLGHESKDLVDLDDDARVQVVGGVAERVVPAIAEDAAIDPARLLPGVSRPLQIRTVARHGFLLTEILKNST